MVIDSWNGDKFIITSLTFIYDKNTRLCLEYLSDQTKQND